MALTGARASTQFDMHVEAMLINLIFNGKIIGKKEKLRRGWRWIIFGESFVKKIKKWNCGKWVQGEVTANLTGGVYPNIWNHMSKFSIYIYRAGHYI